LIGTGWRDLGVEDKWLNDSEVSSSVFKLEIFKKRKKKTHLKINCKVKNVPSGL